MAHAIVHALENVLAPDCLPVFNSDGLKLYFYVCAHSTLWQLGRGCGEANAPLASQRGATLRTTRQTVSATPSGPHERRAALGSLDQLAAALHTFGWSGKIQNAFVERLNLTVRQAVAALTRRTRGIAQSSAELMLHLEW
jgi:hypothetical protein